ncbi:MAG: DNA repair protein RadC [Alphaproteobacteria bacterium]|nr:DNA repair protein RadC [Alphaproteobacteria bacterium]
MSEKSEPIYIGHRQRLKERFIRSEGADMADYEAVELLLTYAIPRRDVKPLAKALIKEFGSFAGVISAPMDRLLEVSGIKDNSAVLIKFVEFAAKKLSWQNLAFEDAPYITSTDSLIEFCRCSMGYSEVEVLRLIYVDSKLKVIGTEILQKGSISSVNISPRDIVTKALKKNASGIIMVHNHPSGDPRPSKNDIEATKSVKLACDAVGVTLHEHIVITPSDFYSFAQRHLII